MALPNETEVLIVGAGPTGLALAVSLTEKRIPFLLIDRLTEAATTSRAAAVHARTLEVLETIGVAEEMVKRGRQVPSIAIQDQDQTLLKVDFSDLPTGYRFVLTLPQSETEAILARRLEAFGGRIARGYEARAVRQGKQAAEVDIADASGTLHTIQARFVVGADGYHSAVREAAGIGFIAGTYAQSFVLADVYMDWPLPTDEMRAFLASDGLVFIAPLPGEGHFRIIADADQPAEQPTLADVQTILDSRGPRSTPAKVRQVVWSSRFKIHHGVAASYRAGRVFLAGDAAHVHSPAGGQGMNIGIQDAVALGERLAAVISGQQPDSHLDGYQQQRRPVAEKVVAMTDQMTRMATLTSPVGQRLRNIGIMLAGHLPAVRRKIASRMAELDS